MEHPITPPNAAPAEPPVSVRHLVKRFGRLAALDDVTFDVVAGETFGLIGPNGSGKTTLIRLLLGMAAPTSGEVVVLGRRMPDRRAARQIGYMTQASALYADLNVRENLAFFGSLYGLAGKALAQRITETLALVDLSDRRDTTVGQLSGGMRQRLSLAIALIHQPRLLFLDEPTVGIDPELRLQFWDYFATLNQQGVTILVSTHHLDEARRCNRLALLRFGKLLALDAPDALLRASGREDFDQAFLYYAQRDEMAPGQSAAHE
ncbi:MAG TPA: ABC transporter ATP-binding protein [Ktedonobacterales bacterium]